MGSPPPALSIIHCCFFGGRIYTHVFGKYRNTEIHEDVSYSWKYSIFLEIYFCIRRIYSPKEIQLDTNINKPHFTI